MSTPTRIYRWQDRLIRATHPSHVLAFVAQGLDRPKVATQDDLEHLLGNGVKVESIKSEQQELASGATRTPGVCCSLGRWS